MCDSLWKINSRRDAGSFGKNNQMEIGEIYSKKFTHIYLELIINRKFMKRKHIY